MEQTRPIDEILLVDNDSQDGALDRDFPEKVSILKPPENLGTAGGVAFGWDYAIERGYDWVWVMDDDSEAQKDALEKLIELNESLPSDIREEVGFLGSLPLYHPDLLPKHGGVFSSKGMVDIQPDAEAEFYPCDINIWSGSLYRMKVVREIGLPSKDYFMDWGEFEYCHRVKQAGYKGFIHQKSVIHHNIGGPSLKISTQKLGPMKLYAIEFPPLRCYYMMRNMIYFSLYDNRCKWFVTLTRNVMKIAKLKANFMIRPINHGPHISACFRGLWDGLTGKIHRRY